MTDRRHEDVTGYLKDGRSWGYVEQSQALGNKMKFVMKVYGCDHTSTNAPDPIRTPQLSVLGRE